tara:strand:- start:234 stop:431 length:198 start_codon:yes stop_codon:yes gene_type:complete
MKKYKFRDTSTTEYSIEAKDIEEAERIFDTMWLHKQHSIDDLCIKNKINRTQKIWIEYKNDEQEV